jgi:NADPH2:quinone reductase
MPFILRGVHLLGADSVNCPLSLRQRIWNKLAVDWRPDRVHDQVRTIDFDELPTHFDPYLKGMVRGRPSCGRLDTIPDRRGSGGPRAALAA